MSDLSLWPMRPGDAGTVQARTAAVRRTGRLITKPRTAMIDMSLPLGAR
jgi:hypothetical protein